MIIESPTLQDIPELVKESKPMFDEMGFEEYGNNWELESMIEWWTDVINKPVFEILVARENNRIIGVSVACYVNKFFWHKGKLHANELAHHAAPDLPTYKRCKIMIKLLNAMVDIFKTKNVEFFKIGYDPKPQFSAWGDYLMKQGFISSSHVLVAKVGNL